MVECFWCGTVYDGTKYRWLCPTCHYKESCCDGAPCDIPKEVKDVQVTNEDDQGGEAR